MCKCTPEIRTPFCGRGDCLPPASREPTESLFAANAEREFARMAHGDHLAQFKADQLDAWERRLAQFSNRSDSTGYVGRIGVEVLTELRQTREQAEALATRAEQAEARVAELEELVTSLWMHKPGDCDACNSVPHGVTGVSAMAFNKDKFRNLILYIAEQSRDDVKFGATKLNKILYFADFESYGLWGRAITGSTYVRLDRGPVPKEILPVLREMEDSGLIRRTERTYFHHTQKVVEPLEPATLAVFEARELDLVDKVMAELRQFNADEVSALSHLDDGWRLAEDREVIPYSSVYISSLSAVGGQRGVRRVEDDDGYELSRRRLRWLSASPWRWRQLLTERIHRHSTRNPLA